MRMRQNVLDILEQLKEVVETAKDAMERKSISPEKIYKVLQQTLNDVERITIIVNREIEE